MIRTVAAYAVACVIAAVLAVPSVASEFPDMRGIWGATYIAVSPSRGDEPGPRFNEAEWRLEIVEQNGNAFWGFSRWRRVGRAEWNTVEATGSLSLGDPGAVVIVEQAPDGDGVKGLIDGRLIDGRLYISFKGTRFGTTFSTVLDRLDGTE